MRNFEWYEEGAGGVVSGLRGRKLEWSEEGCSEGEW